MMGWDGMGRHGRLLPHRGGLVVSVSASHAVGRGFASQSGHTKCHHKNGTNCLPAFHVCVRVGVLTVQSDCLKGQVVRGTIYGDMHLKDLLSPIAREWYRITVPISYLCYTGPPMPKRHSNELIKSHSNHQLKNSNT